MNALLTADPSALPPAAVQCPYVPLAAVHEAGHFLAVLHCGVEAACSSLSDDPGQCKTLFLTYSESELSFRQRVFIALAGPLAAAYWQGECSPEAIARQVSEDDFAALNGRGADDPDVAGALDDATAFLTENARELIATAAVLTRDKVLATDAWLRWESEHALSMSVH